jgi:hypothetical protein
LGNRGLLEKMLFTRMLSSGNIKRNMFVEASGLRGKNAELQRKNKKIFKEIKLEWLSY